MVSPLAMRAARSLATARTTGSVSDSAIEERPSEIEMRAETRTESWLVNWASCLAPILLSLTPPRELEAWRSERGVRPIAVSWR